MTEEQAKVSFSMRCKSFFGLLPGQNVQQFAAELKALSYDDKEELADRFTAAGMPTALPSRLQGQTGGQSQSHSDRQPPAGAANPPAESGNFEARLTPEDTPVDKDRDRSPRAAGPAEKKSIALSEVVQDAD